MLGAVLRKRVPTWFAGPWYAQEVKAVAFAQATGVPIVSAWAEGFRLLAGVKRVRQRILMCRIEVAPGVWFDTQGTIGIARLCKGLG